MEEVILFLWLKIEIFLWLTDSLLSFTSHFIFFYQQIIMKSLLKNVFFSKCGDSLFLMLLIKNKCD